MRTRTPSTDTFGTQTNTASQSNEALLALVRLLARQMAREFLQFKPVPEKGDHDDHCDESA